MSDAVLSWEAGIGELRVICVSMTRNNDAVIQWSEGLQE